MDRESSWSPQLPTDSGIPWPRLLWQVPVSYRPGADSSVSTLCGLPRGYSAAYVGGSQSMIESERAWDPFPCLLLRGSHVCKGGARAGERNHIFSPLSKKTHRAPEKGTKRSVTSMRGGLRKTDQGRLSFDQPWHRSVSRMPLESGATMVRPLRELIHREMGLCAMNAYVIPAPP